MYQIFVRDLVLNELGATKSVVDQVTLSPVDDYYQLLGPVSIDLVITNVGEGLLVNGQISGQALMTCNRCTNKATVDIAFDFEEEFKSDDQRFTLTDEDKRVGRDDLQFSIDDNGLIDLEPALLQAIFSELPIVAACQDCQGQSATKTYTF